MTPPAPQAPPTTARTCRTPRTDHVRLLWVLAVAVVVIDQATKAWAVSALADGHRVALVGDLLGLVLLRNPGAAFSFATGQTWILTLIAAVVTVVVLRVSRRLGSLWWAVALGLVLGGAVGNLLDRLLRSPGVLRGHVVDFIDYGGLFVGNVADIAIVAAAGAIMVLSLYGLEVDGSRAGHPKRPEDTTEDPAAAPTEEPAAEPSEDSCEAPAVEPSPQEAEDGTRA
ncbi:MULTISPECIES: signal peptidase II [unclassified Actinomyces]|uniref:signal peptidase II n=1 Tax=unclassified Actinomyces TaxID=2609248 RepID=UPI002017F4B8|nr:MULTISPECIES: signal peptidase II [unclassified Actinomyces]MCL3778240.1 signal peptidase II [Actinomyces sp. AC-20-1]MCL3789143.1 signal peptidase II [Actinomyces sp. 187325]MCL3791498.1 signal peptidase II [Actinomyces sp. 186855]MCL3794088.1 signal peptidase II [Actinomyces sp. 217892]